MFDILKYEMQSIVNQAMAKLLASQLEGDQLGIDSTLTNDYLDKSGTFAELIQSAASKYDLDPALISSVIQAESNYDPTAVSCAGALGLMQLMPGTANSLGVDDPLDPEQNIDGGVRYLKNMLDRYDGNISLALAAYNAGPGAVDQYDGIPPYSETKTYVDRVMGNYFSSNIWEV